MECIRHVLYQLGTHNYLIWKKQPRWFKWEGSCISDDKNRYRSISKTNSNVTNGRLMPRSEQLGKDWPTWYRIDGRKWRAARHFFLIRTVIKLHECHQLTMFKTKLTMIFLFPKMEIIFARCTSEKRSGRCIRQSFNTGKNPPQAIRLKNEIKRKKFKVCQTSDSGSQTGLLLLMKKKQRVILSTRLGKKQSKQY